ncbi:MAG TPA: hypothetical protein VJZ00_21305 [Thermoanaerobaculia bacterium]|nr:hypothetical protein [Thermoanaerobaculia bacterium]
MKNVVAVSFLFLAACAHHGAKAPVTLPEVTVVQTSGVSIAARDVTGPIPVRYAVRVRNQADQPITLKRIQAQSIGAGAYTLPSTSRPFNAVIEPAGQQDVQFWASAVVEYNTITGANGPVTLRLILNFDSPLGSFQDVVVQEVNDRFTGEIR